MIHSINIWVCLKIGYIPSYSHLIGIMISKTIGFRGTQHFQTHPYLAKKPATFWYQGETNHSNDSSRRHVLSIKVTIRGAPRVRLDELSPNGKCSASATVTLAADLTTCTTREIAMSMRRPSRVKRGWGWEIGLLIYTIYVSLKMDIKQREKDGMKVYSNTLWECCGILWDSRDFTSKCHGFPAGDMGGNRCTHLYHLQRRWTNCSAYGTTMDMISRRWSMMELMGSA